MVKHMKVSEVLQMWTIIQGNVNWCIKHFNQFSDLLLFVKDSELLGSKAWYPASLYSSMAQEIHS